MGRCGSVLAVPGLLLLADWQGRVWLGEAPSSFRAVATPNEPDLIAAARRAAGNASWETISTASRLRAKGDGQGNLLVESLDGGPAFQRPPDPDPELGLSYLQFSPNGRILAVCDAHRMYSGSRVTIWDVAPGDGVSPPIVCLRHELPRGEHHFCDVRFFPDGKALLVCNGDKTVLLWDVESGRQIASFVPKIGESWNWPADCAAVSPDGQTFATWAMHGIGIWDRSSLRLIRAMDTHHTIPVALSYSPDSRTLIAVAREGIWQWKLAPSPVPFLLLLLAITGIIVWILLSTYSSRSAVMKSS